MLETRLEIKLSPRFFENTEDQEKSVILGWFTVAETEHLYLPPGQTDSSG